MKKLLVCILSIFVMAALLCGCMGMGDSGMSDTQKTPSPTESINPDVDQTAPPIAKEEAEKITPTTSGTNPGNVIGEEKAKEMALSRAGVTADGVTFEKVKLDLDDGVWRYEVEFRKGNTEYDVEVKADDGAILEYEKDMAN